MLTALDSRSSNWSVSIATEFARVFIWAYVFVPRGPQPSSLALQGSYCSWSRAGAHSQQGALLLGCRASCRPWPLWFTCFSPWEPLPASVSHQLGCLGATHLSDPHFLTQTTATQDGSEHCRQVTFPPVSPSITQEEGRGICS